MAALSSFKRIGGPFQLLLLLLLQDLVEPAQFQCHGPKDRITAGSWAPFECSANNLPSKDVHLVWMKDGGMIPSKQSYRSTEMKGERVYHVKSIVEILLGQGDVRSQLSCLIQDYPVEITQKIFHLGPMLIVPPTVHLETIPASPIQMDAKVMITCNAESFYPENAAVELFDKDAPSRRGTVSPRISNPDGTFSLKSFMEVTATEDKDSSMFLCQIQQDSQPLVNETTRIFIMKESESSQQQSILLFCIMLFLTKVAILLSIFCFFLIKVLGRKGTNDHSGTFQEVRESGTSS